MSESILMSVAGTVAFVLMLSPATRPRGAPHRRGGLDLLTAAATAINVAGVVGLAELTLETLSYGGFLREGPSTALPGAAILALTALAIVLRRQGRVGWALLPLLIAAVPTAAALGLLLYLEANPINMR